MFKYILLAFAVWALPCAVAHADETPTAAAPFYSLPPSSWYQIVKESIDATHATEIPATPDSSLIPSDLAWDLNFGTGGGYQVFFLDDNNNKEGRGLRVVARPRGGWYLLGKHVHGNGTWDAAVVSVNSNGSPQAEFIVPTPMFRLDDATLDPSTGKFYFAGGAKQAGSANSDFAVTCVDITVGSGGTCAGFGNSGTAYIAFDRGGNLDDVARRVVVRPNIGVLLGGWAKDATDRYVFAVAALYRSSGALLSRFGNNGKFHTDLDSTLGNVDVNVFDMTLSNDPDSEARLYIAGNYSLNTERKDYDGVVLAVNAWTGQFDTSFNGSGFRTVWLDLGDPSINRSDAVTAMTIQANGKLALAGWSVNTRLENIMMIARLKTNGQLDQGLCSGSGKCAPFQGQDSGLPTYYWPTAIAERPTTRDWLIASEYKVGGNSDWASKTTQLMTQFSGSGIFREFNKIELGSATGQTSWTVPAYMLVTSDAVMAAGTRRYTTVGPDYDATLVRLLVNNSIFADQFGGPNSD